MKITAFNGSPRGKNSNTSIMVSGFFKGAADAGAETEQIYLSEKNIAYCRGCFKCWTATPGKCVIRDDMPELLEKVMSSDVIIMATPLYVDGVTAILKAFMDRLIPLLDPHFEEDDNGEWRHAKLFESYPKIMVISNCGMSGQEHFQPLKLHFQRVARNMHSVVSAGIYLEAGELLHNRSLALKPLLSNYRKYLRRAGKELVTTGSISKTTAGHLAKPVIKGRIYMREANKHWDRELKKLEKNS
jgi:multimeric flavodoxin WrbA